MARNLQVSFLAIVHVINAMKCNGIWANINRIDPSDVEISFAAAVIVKV